jgi:hypothetical protein
MPLSRKNRKASRKNRKNSRKNMRKSRRNRRQHGGSAMAQSLAQGRQFASFHSNQHGGAALMGAPLSEIDGSRLPDELRSFARVGGLDASIADAATQRDPDQLVQKGGRRRNMRKNRKNSRKASRKNSRKASRKNSRKASRKNSRKASRKNRKNSRKASRKNRKNSRKNRKQHGGSLSGAPYNQPTMLLSASAAAKAGTADFSNPLLKN